MSYIKKNPKSKDVKWTERNIANALAIKAFSRRYLCVVPNCSWTGNECDLLVVTENLRIIDVEIKISRSDLKADSGKDKWRYGFDAELDGGYAAFGNYTPRKREWPNKVWKHYYAMPYEIWDDKLFESMPTQNSGVILLWQEDGVVYPMVKRMAKPCRDAQQISAQSAIDIARLASLRMWESQRKLDNLMEESTQ